MSFIKIQISPGKLFMKVLLTKLYVSFQGKNKLNFFKSMSHTIELVYQYKIMDLDFLAWDCHFFPIRLMSMNTELMSIQYIRILMGNYIHLGLNIALLSAFPRLSNNSISY